MKVKATSIITVVIFALTFALGSVQVHAQITITCGAVVESEFTTGQEIHRYNIFLSPGYQLYLRTEAVGQLLDVYTYVYDPAERQVAQSSGSSIIKEIISPQLSTRGTYRINVSSGNRAGGIYTLYVGCTFRDGTIINPGDSPEAPSTPVATASPVDGFGFPGLSPRDFSQGIELPLLTGQAQTVPIGADVALYTYRANANEIRILRLSRLSGAISIGVTVINRDTNEIIFFGGLPWSNNLTVELTFPSAGTYVIGLFRVDTAERSGTSGAVQIILE